MDKSRIEPGLLPVFRLFIGLRWALFLLIFFDIVDAVEKLQTHLYLFIIMLAELGFLSIYLSWPWLQRKLGHRYLPIALIVNTVLPIVEKDLMLRHIFIEGVTADIKWHAIEMGSLELLVVLIAPLFLISWQYRFRTVLLFCLGTAAFQVALLAPSPLVHLTLRGQLLAYKFTEEIFIRTPIFILLGYLIVRLMNIQREQRRALIQANDKLVAYAATLEQLTVSRERNRMARELHDTLAHTLSGLAVQLDSVTSRWQAIPPEAGAMIEQSLATVRSGLDETRRALQSLRATPLEDLGLILALHTLASEMAARGNLSLEMDIAEDINNLPPAVEHCYYRVAQEALENVVKHANAQKVSLHLKRRDNLLTLTVADDGDGFTPETAIKEHHFGIKGMQERAEMIGATFAIESQPGQGTTIRLMLEKGQ